MNITFRQIEVFLAVARSLSFSQAAVACHLSQPALSATIKRLEETLSVKLFERTTRQVSLTDVGLEFQRLAEHLSDSVLHTQVRIKEYAAGKRGRLSIAAGPSIAAGFIPQVLKVFGPQHPDVEIRIHDELSDTCLEMVRAGKADIALTPAMHTDSDLVSVPLFKDYLVVLFPLAHPLAQKKTVRWSDLQAYPQVAVNNRSNLRQTINEQYRALGADFAPAYEVAQVATMLGLIHAGLGVGVLSESLVERASLDGLAHRKLNSRSAYRRICTTVLAHRAPPPVLTAFLTLCKQVAAARG
ncbi:MAG: LysR family transcriptional regulator [Phenylobacterium sp.]|uniref:LysR family transcriptional regulator n=1 Tax=Phenylobacterium sp. TaxID=1871053 RepID=UPI0027373035|nr:LysR family transcriptional regulator [Phenylobacterium sp.]MDP3175298.1 LysR family transcriptional regulator [Phenylobacterium sp.]MDP3521197.1 LysR family transcriptional regulator [Hydrogenophaga sp.]